MPALTQSSPKIAPPRRPATNIIAFGVVIALVYFGRDLLVTLCTAITLGFLLEPSVDLVMRLRLPRPVASFLVCAFSLALVYLTGLGMYYQGAAMLDELPVYSARMGELGDEFSRRLESTERGALQIFAPRRYQQEQAAQLAAQEAARQQAGSRRRSAEPPLPAPAPTVQEVRIRQDRSLIVNYISDHWERFYQVGLLVSFIPFLVYFMLSWRDHMRKSYLQLFHGADRHAAGRSLQSIADMARAYVVGNFVLGLILTGASGFFFWLLQIKYWLLVAPLSGFLSLVPYVGLPIAMIPPFFAALPTYPKLGAYVIIGAVVAFLHLVAMNLLYPKLVGARVHLNPMVVTVALMFWGSLWGAIGLVFAIPITAAMKSVFDNVPELEAYGKLLGD